MKDDSQASRSHSTISVVSRNDSTAAPRPPTAGIERCLRQQRLDSTVKYSQETDGVEQGTGDTAAEFSDFSDAPVRRNAVAAESTESLVAPVRRNAVATESTESLNAPVRRNSVASESANPPDALARRNAIWEDGLSDRTISRRHSAGSASQAGLLRDIAPRSQQSRRRASSVSCAPESNIAQSMPDPVEMFGNRVPRKILAKDPARILGPRELLMQRTVFFGTIIMMNSACLLAAVLGHKGLWIFVLILFIKSKDFLSSIISPIGLMSRRLRRKIKPPGPVPPQLILTLIPAYSESEEQIVKTIFSLRDNNVEPHFQVMCVVLDGKHKDVKRHITRPIRSFERPYVTFKFKKISLMIDIGFIEDVPVIIIEKRTNAGKKDSLIMCHDLFNYPRQNIPLCTRMLRQEFWEDILPGLTIDRGIVFTGFDMVFCTDADSIIHQGAVASLANALASDKDAIAACGLVLVELEPGCEWSLWNLYQQFQYCFGCITMISVRPELAGAIEKYAEPVVDYPVIHHQVQYLGTDRRLTYSLLSQNIKLHTLFVPEAVSETVAPQSLQHYLSQRRRWGSNAYFNNYFYCFGENMSPITRLAASVELIRLSLVYYRFCNTMLFVKNLSMKIRAGDFHVMSIVPLLLISQFPTIWFTITVMIEPQLRKRAHKLLLGFCINKAIGPFMSVTVFTKVSRNVGSQVWGMSGVTVSSAAPAITVPIQMAPELITPDQLAPGQQTGEVQAASMQMSEPPESIDVSRSGSLYPVSPRGSVSHRSASIDAAMARVADIPEDAQDSPRRGSTWNFTVTDAAATIPEDEILSVPITSARSSSLLSPGDASRPRRRNATAERRESIVPRRPNQHVRNDSAIEEVVEDDVKES